VRKPAVHGPEHLLRRDGPDVPFRSHHILHAGHVVGVQTYTGTRHGDLDLAHDTALAALTLLPGPIRFREPPWRRAEDQVDLGWRVRDGSLESALTGLRVTPARGWSLTTAREQAKLGSLFELTLAHGATGGSWYPSYGPTEIMPDDIGPMLNDWLAGLGAVPLGEERTLSRGAWGPVRLELWNLNGVIVGVGAECHGALCLAHQTEATGAIDPLLEAWRAGPPMIEVLDDAARAALVADLATAEPTLRDGGPDWSVVGDAWWHRTAGIGARLPRDLMVHLGSEVAELGREGVLFAREPWEGASVIG
jgi:hypothetical protein